MGEDAGILKTEQARFSEFIFFVHAHFAKVVIVRGRTRRVRPRAGRCAYREIFFVADLRMQMSEIILPSNRERADGPVATNLIIDFPGGEREYLSGVRYLFS